MFIINFCLNMFRASSCPSSGEQKPCYCMRRTALVLLDVVGSGCGALRCRTQALWRFLFNSVKQKPSQCSHPTTQHPTTATNHIQQNQRSTPHAVTRSLFSWRWAWWCPKHVETEVDNKHLIIASCWFFLSLHTLLTIHGHRNLQLAEAYFNFNHHQLTQQYKQPYSYDRHSIQYSTSVSVKYSIRQVTENHEHSMFHVQTSYPWIRLP